jgi:hypothetical protein
MSVHLTYPFCLNIQGFLDGSRTNPLCDSAPVGQPLSQDWRTLRNAAILDDEASAQIMRHHAIQTVFQHFRNLHSSMTALQQSA